MQFDIRSNIADVVNWVNDAQRRQLPFVTVLAMTRTAQEVKAAEIDVMRKVFDRPTPYTLNALRVQPATKAVMVASVEFRGGGTPARRFLNPEAHGGPRSQKSTERRLQTILGGVSYLVPGRGADLDQYGNIKGATFRRILSQLKAGGSEFADASSSRRSKRNRAASAFFVAKGGKAILERRGTTVKPVLVFSGHAPAYTARFPFEATAERVVAEKFSENFVAAFERAIATSSFKSKASAPYSVAGAYQSWRGSSAKSALFG